MFDFSYSCMWLYPTLRQHGLTEQLFHTLGMDVVSYRSNSLVRGLADKGTSKYRCFPWLPSQSKVSQLK